MTVLNTALVISAPRDQVFAFFTNFEESAKHLHRAFKIEFHSPKLTGLGAEWTEHDGDPDEAVVSRRKITAFDPPHSYTMTSDDKDSFETMDFRFTDQGLQTLVAFDLTIKPKGLLRGIFVGLGKGMIFSMMEEDLNRIKSAIESGSVG